MTPANPGQRARQPKEVRGDCPGPDAFSSCFMQKQFIMSCYLKNRTYDLLLAFLVGGAAPASN
jgi:hypothetical protein